MVLNHPLQWIHGLRAKTSKEIIEEARELQRVFSSDVPIVIEELFAAKSDSSSVIYELQQTKCTYKKLTEEITELKKQVAELTFQDITIESMQLSASVPVIDTETENSIKPDKNESMKLSSNTCKTHSNEASPDEN